MIATSQPQAILSPILEAYSDYGIMALGQSFVRKLIGRMEWFVSWLCDCFVYIILPIPSVLHK